MASLELSDAPASKKLVFKQPTMDSTGDGREGGRDPWSGASCLEGAFHPATLEEICHWGRALKVQKTHTVPCSSLFVSWLCLKMS